MKKKRIVLFGGSFNPTHIDHMKMAESLHKFSNCDEVWMMFAQNNFKDPKDYVSLENRLEIATLLKDQFPDTPIVLNTLQEEMDTHETIEVLRELNKRYPDYEFTWSMGIDSLIRFHEWGGYQEMIENYNMIIVDREGYTEAGLNSPAMDGYHDLLGTKIQLLQSDLIGSMSSTKFKEQLLKNPNADFGPMNVVAEYAREKGLYGLNSATQTRTKKRAYAP